MARRHAKKKHRGIKDPYKQIEERFNKIKHKVNRKPVNDMTQEISRKLQMITDFQKGKPSKENDESQTVNGVKRKKSKKRKKSAAPPLIDTARLAYTEKEEYGMVRPLKKIPRLVQYSDETDGAFLKRVGRAAKDILSESKFEEKFKVEVDRDESGAVVKVKHKKALDDPLLPAKKRAKLEAREDRKKEKKKERDLKRKQKGKRKRGDEDDFRHFQDKVEFGEVAYEPPSLDTSKFAKMANNDTKTKSFIFMKKLKGSQAGKMPELTETRKQMLEEERLKAVQAYRDMKAAKYMSENKNFALI
ncbi:coiled-coil domain-containing protein 137-like [Macrobrachium nipponense]|uniref:coiled-coil domain-containing protein 137-like n=1 Tax=Macrobrachium nipponense TaxID=159736 RepID=UPI0030C7D4A7